MVTNLLAIQEAWVRFLGSEGALEEDMATHSSILAWRIPITGDPPHVSVVSGMPPDARSQAAGPRRDGVARSPPKPAVYDRHTSEGALLKTHYFLRRRYCPLCVWYDHLEIVVKN